MAVVKLMDERSTMPIVRKYAATYLLLLTMDCEELYAYCCEGVIVVKMPPLTHLEIPDLEGKEWKTSSKVV